MTPEQQLALDAITADVTAAQALVARAAHKANGADAQGIAEEAREPIADALTALRTASEELRKAALNG